MKEKCLEIKEKRSGFMGKGFIYLFCALITLFVALIPYGFSNIEINKYYLLIPGGIGFITFAILFVSHLNRECIPSNAIVLNENGFISYNSSGNIEIPWTNVASMKLYGNSESPCLGIYLENVDIVIVKLKLKYAEAMEFNIEEGLAPILIYQSDIRIKLSELKEHFTEYILASRDIEKNVPEKNKKNPFTTDDVLKAFGKLPPNTSDSVTDDDASKPEGDMLENPLENDSFYMALNELSDDSGDSESNNSNASTYSDEEFAEEVIQYDNDSYSSNARSLPSTDTIVFEERKPKDDDIVTDTVETTDETDMSDESEAVNTNDSNEIDDLFSIMSSNAYIKEEEEEDSDENPTDTSSEDLSNEIQALLSRARSSKIDELGKILNEKDLPYSYGKTSEPSKLADEEPIHNESVTDKCDESTDEETTPPTVDDVIAFPVDSDNDTSMTTSNNINEVTEDDDELSFEKNLEAMINKALSQSKETKNPHPENEINLDSAMFKNSTPPKKTKNEYPDLVIIEDNETKINKKNKEEIDEIIIPDIDE